MRLEKTTERAGRVSHKGRPLGVWWKCEDEGGYVAKCGPLGDFLAPTLDALLSAIENAEIKRLMGAATVLSRLRKRRQQPEIEDSEITPEKKTGCFARLLRLYMLTLRAGWPPLMALQLGPSTLLALLTLTDETEPAPASLPRRNAGL